MKRIMFFAVRDDLLPVFESVERASPLQYVKTGNYSRQDFGDGPPVFPAGADLPLLGEAKTNDAITCCGSYLVCAREAAIGSWTVQGVSGERVCVDQAMNPDTVVLQTGGLWGEEVLLNGRVATISDSRASQSLMRRFHSAMKKTFKKVRAFHVGPGALLLLEQGKRLTISEQAAPEFDLKP